MRTKPLAGRGFSYFWNGIIHLEDGSPWRLTDPGCGNDVSWWQSGEPVAFERKRGGLLLRNELRGESVPVEALIEGELKLAA